MQHYTVDEARALLPDVIPVVEAMRGAYRSLRAMQAAVAADSRGATADGVLLANAFATDDGPDEVERVSKDLRTAAAQLDRWSIEIKDPERGLIDFFSEREGETVYLCYLLGEPELAWWHRMSDGFAGRRPL